MTVVALKRPPPPISYDLLSLDALRGLLDHDRLVDIGWDPVTQTIAPRPDAWGFGYAVCAVIDCRAAINRGAVGGNEGLCKPCGRRLRYSKMRKDEFLALRRNPAEPDLCRICRIPGHMRPAWTHGFCPTHAKRKASMGWTDEQLIASAAPLPSTPPCQKVGCSKHSGISGLCHGCFIGLRQLRRRRPGNTVEEWALIPVEVKGGPPNFDLSVLSERLRLELLWAAQYLAEADLRSPLERFGEMYGGILRLGSESVMSAELPSIKTRWPGAVRMVQRAMAAATADPEEEIGKDIWDLRVLGRDPSSSSGRYVHFEGIHQRWLRSAAKLIAADQLPTKHANTLRHWISGLVALSESLLDRADGGHDHTMLGRPDIMRFLHHPRIWKTCSADTRAARVQAAHRFFRLALDSELQLDGGPLRGLPREFRFKASDVPAIRDDDQEEIAGKGLPHVVLRQLESAPSLALLREMYGDDGVALVQLQIRVGRRTAEICILPIDCLQYDEEFNATTGEMRTFPVLVHDMPKVKRKGHRIPLPEGEDIILEQRARVQQRYPNVPVSKLPLFPRRTKNPSSVPRAIGSQRLSKIVRVWVDALPSLTDENGNAFDRLLVTPYSFRHSYAQRHVDANVSVHDLKELMGHKDINTTQGYFVIGRERLRNASAVGAKYRVTYTGAPVAPIGQRALDSDKLRSAVGSIGVPHGLCFETTNVKAAGTACPKRYVCDSCEHFRTDLTYLDELRVRLARMIDDDEGWVAQLDPELMALIADKTPQAQQIKALRKLLKRMEEMEAQLPDHARAQLEEAREVLSRGRARTRTALEVHLHAPRIAHPEPLHNPTVAAVSVEAAA